jgi:FkbM family methyltransferase
MLSVHRINLVLDIGANTGQFGIYLRNAGYKGRIISFEPLSSARTELLTSSRNDPLWDVAPRAAIGSHDGQVEINVAKNSVSSSALNILEAHIAADPESQFIGKELVPLRRLDSIVFDYLDAGSRAFLKIDTQGYEDQVLKGATTLLGRIIGLQVELSLVPLYEGQQLFDDLSRRLRSLDFELWSIAPVFVDPKTGRLLQADVTFYRSRN